MAEEIRRVHIENLPVTDNGGLRVELVPMPASDDPWRTREEYDRGQRRDTIRFWGTVASLIISLLSVLATSAVAISTIKGLT